VDSISLPQLADYCTLIALAQVDPKADVASFETILNVFIDPTITGLTGWDRDYLAALYGIEQNRLGSARWRDRRSDDARRARGPGRRLGFRETPATGLTGLTGLKSSESCDPRLRRPD
jgi:hypothetical protein